MRDTAGETVKEPFFGVSDHVKSMGYESKMADFRDSFTASGAVSRGSRSLATRNSPPNPRNQRPRSFYHIPRPFAVAFKPLQRGAGIHQRVGAAVGLQ